MTNHAIQIIPTHRGVGLTSSIIGLFHAFHRLGIKATYYKPIEQDNSHSQAILQHVLDIQLPQSMPALRADQLLSENKADILLEEILITYEKLKEDYQIVIIGGLLETKAQPYAVDLNRMVAKAIGADIVLATDAINVSTLSQFEHKMEFAATEYGGTQSLRVLGAIVNRIGSEGSLPLDQIMTSELFTDKFKLLAAVPQETSLNAPRTIDAIEFLNGKMINEGEADSRRISNYALIARTIPNAMPFLSPGYLVITPSDRDDVIMAATLVANSGVQLAGLILTGETDPTPEVFELCKPQIEAAGLPVARVQLGSWEIAKAMDNFDLNTPPNDTKRALKTMEHFADHIDPQWCKTYIDSHITPRQSPAAFKYQIVKSAQVYGKTIVLPEGDEPRTVVAANTCVNRGIANCLLLANPESVRKVAATHGIELNPQLQIIDPEQVREEYVARLVELRKHKGMDETIARTQLADNVMLGTMMLEANTVDGLVSGAVHTTANTIRPPLQIIKTAANASLVSSVFFMCLPDQVYVYGDCAINPNPNAEQLAEIAIQSADSAKAFGIDPKVAMLSYSTGTSGSGEDVERVLAATQKVRELRPDIAIDGPLQYDAAVIPSVAKKKAPNSAVAGQANVFIFPDLNTGNTTYKAVQRSANAISIGPMLQGMRKPVNDLSRGALIDDIIYTIAITAVQAIQAENS